MDSSEAAQLWQKVTALERRVAELEALTVQRSGAAGRRSPALPEAGSPEERPVISFVAPEQPSLESRIGSQWLNRVGILAVLIGAAWFLKYAVDREWLGPLPRVLIGAGAGLGLIGWSERFRRHSYPVFSFSLKAIGTGLLYLVLWASFALFGLLSYPEAFLGMALVTAANGVLCWVQRSEVLAGYAAIGGFLTPALLAQPHASVLTLGSYLLLLNGGLMTLLALGRWPRLLLPAFAGTAGYLVSLAWEAPELRSDGQGTAAALLAVLFLAVFSLAPLILPQFRAGAAGSAAPPVARATALLNGAFGLVELWRLLPAGSSLFHALPALLAIWYAALLLWERVRRGVPGLLQPGHAGLAVSFAAIGIWSGFGPGGLAVNVPVIAGWAMEAGLLLLLAQRTEAVAGNRVLRSPMPAASILLFAAIMLVIESVSHHLPSGGRMFLNQQFALYVLVIAVAVLAVRLAARRHAVHHDGGAEAEWTGVGRGAAIAATVLLLLAGGLENHGYWQSGAALPANFIAEQFWDSAWATLLGVALLVLGFRLRWAFLRWQALVVLVLAIAKVFFVDTRALSQGFQSLSFLGLGVLLLLVSFIYQRDLLRLRGKEHGG